jgi:hypothetical protein
MSTNTWLAEEKKEMEWNFAVYNEKLMALNRHCALRVVEYRPAIRIQLDD